MNILRCTVSKTSKNVEFYFKNKFEKLVHLVGFIVTIYHDARSPECQIYVLPFAVFKILCILPAPSIYLFCMDLTTSGDDNPIRRLFL